MPEYSYTAMAPTGQRSLGKLTAASEREAMSILDARGLFPIRIDADRALTAATGGGRRIKPRFMATFYAQLADLLRSGVPLMKSLEILERQTPQVTLAFVIRELKASVAEGHGLATSMARHPNAFNELAISMVRAGEEGGFLEDVLTRIAEFTEKQEELKSKVIGALAYPIFLAVIGFAILNILIIVFVPKFKTIFDNLEKKGALPWLTKALIAISGFIQSYWWAILIVIVAAVVAIREWARTEAGRLTLDGWRLSMPGAGHVYLNLAIARFSRILGTMLQNGIPILQALRIAKDSTGNRVLTRAIEKSAENLKAGESLAGPLGASKYFPRDVVEIVAVGEESNNLEKVLLEIADGLERRTSRELDLFVRLLEPVMLLVMALLILTVVIGLLLPIFKMSSAIG